ncbi:MAG: ParB/RepB/Spo0J family partition protein, partial [Lachnospiraceae bacterium]|nr:ParB/RepB/Spo0J family partition protein [Lachnospiraceae bacterium]
MSKVKSASKIRLTNFDDLFQPTDPTEKQYTENEVAQLPIEQLVTFHNHPYKVLDDDKMQELVSSIKDSGILSPLVVRKIAEAQYEIISGHRRTRAAKLCGLAVVPAIIREMADDEAAIAMVNANQQREQILPSEKAKAYQIKYEAMKHQGQ